MNLPLKKIFNFGTRCCRKCDDFPAKNCMIFRRIHVPFTVSTGAPNSGGAGALIRAAWARQPGFRHDHHVELGSSAGASRVISATAAIGHWGMPTAATLAVISVTPKSMHSKTSSRTASAAALASPWAPTSPPQVADHLFQLRRQAQDDTPSPYSHRGFLPPAGHASPRSPGGSGRGVRSPGFPREDGAAQQAVLELPALGQVPAGRDQRRLRFGQHPRSQAGPPPERSVKDAEPDPRPPSAPAALRHDKIGPEPSSRERRKSPLRRSGPAAASGQTGRR
jgi:hypothetical protein